MSYLNAGADWRKRNYLIEPDDGPTCNNTGDVMRVTEEAFDAVALAGVIDFTEVALLTANPLITAAMYGGPVDVQAGPCFLAQSYQTIFDPLGPGYLKGTITAPLTVNTSGSPGIARTVTDGAWNPPFDPPRVLAGDADFTLGLPFVIGFSEDVIGVKFTLGGFNATRSVRVRAYDRDGNLLWEGTNTEPDSMTPSNPKTFETFCIARDSSVAIIAGVSIEISASESNGVALKNIQFCGSCVNAPEVPTDFIYFLDAEAQFDAYGTGVQNVPILLDSSPSVIDADFLGIEQASVISSTQIRGADYTLNKFSLYASPPSTEAIAFNGASLFVRGVFQQERSNVQLFLGDNQFVTTQSLTVSVAAGVIELSTMRDSVSATTPYVSPGSFSNCFVEIYIPPGSGGAPQLFVNGVEFSAIPVPSEMPDVIPTRVLGMLITQNPLDGDMVKHVICWPRVLTESERSQLRLWAVNQSQDSLL